MNILKKVIAISMALVLVTSVLCSTLISASALSQDARYYESIPETVYATVGEPFEIFYENIVSLPDLTIIFTVPESIKKNYYNDRIVLTPQTSGDYNITWRVYDREYVFVESGEMNLIARTKNLDDISVLVLGDSTVFAGSMTQIMLDVFEENNAKLILHGTMGYGENLYEGRGGWRSYDYCNMYENDGLRNPFYNECFDFSYYMESQEYDDLDAVIIQLGINDVKRFTFENYSSKKTLSAFDSMISSIKEYDEEINIIISLPLLPNSNVEVYDNNYTVSSPIECKTNVIRLIGELTERYKGVENVYFSSGSCSINTTTQLEDAVHPTYEGYKKIAYRHIDVLNFIMNEEIKSEPTKITSGLFKNNGVSLEWVPMSNADYYEIVRIDKGTVLKTTEAFCIDASVKSGNTYKYIIRTHYENGSV
ncbi:MAG: SGNH/GDSL hydrolase family protein, partial [Clostridia bacterium]|nr:SGNH/GDSL hydrolase family protein [Clostridia bacterium]